MAADLIHKHKDVLLHLNPRILTLSWEGRLRFEMIGSSINNFLMVLTTCRRVTFRVLVIYHCGVNNSRHKIHASGGVNGIVHATFPSFSFFFLIDTNVCISSCKPCNERLLSKNLKTRTLIVSCLALRTTCGAKNVRLWWDGDMKNKIISHHHS